MKTSLWFVLQRKRVWVWVWVGSVLSQESALGSNLSLTTHARRSQRQILNQLSVLVKPDTLQVLI